MLSRMEGARTYRFSITVTVQPAQEGFDDPV
jgi:hypothetical protein